MDFDKGRPIFKATMPLKRFKTLSRAVRFDQRDTRNESRPLDKFAHIPELSNQWVEITPNLCNPSENVKIDEQFVAFIGRCLFHKILSALR